MVIIGALEVEFVRKAVGQDVVDSLDMEGLLDFGVGSDEEVEEDQGWEEENENIES